MRRKGKLHLDFNWVVAPLCLLVVFQGLLILGLFRQISDLERLVRSGRLLTDGDSLPVGSLAPQFVATEKFSGRDVGTSFLAGKGGAILFISCECSVCKNLVEDIRVAPLFRVPSLIVVSMCNENAKGLFLNSLEGRVPCICANVQQLISLFHVSGFPTAVVVDSDLKIRGYGNPHDLSALKALLKFGTGQTKTEKFSESDEETAHGQLVSS